MRKLLLLKFFFLLFAVAHAQTMTYSVNYFPNAGYPGAARPASSSVSETTGWAPVLGTSSSTFSANLWSPAIPIPFSFDFYGQPVTHFKASANMLVTFDTAATALPNANTNLPSATLPNKTIAVFWDEFTAAAPTGSGDRVMWKVFGTAPNRQFWIFWYSFEYGNPSLSFAYTAAVLEESTHKIYVVDLYSNTTPAITSTVGVQLDNTVAVQFGDSLLPNGGNSGATVAQVDYYEFMPRAVVPFDVAVSGFISPLTSGCYSTNEQVEVTLTNYGTQAISNVPVTLAVGGAGSGSQTATYTGTIAPNASVDFVIGSVNMSAGGNYEFTAYANHPSDTYAVNDTARTSRTVISAITPSLPIVDFDGFNSSNLSTISPGWYEAQGFVNPSGTTGNWVLQTITGQNTAAVNLYTTSRNEWIVGPKFVNGTNTHLFFKAAVTAWSPAGAASFMGSDDSIRVMISADCGASFKMFSAITVADSLGTNLRQYDLDLSAIPTGTELIVAFQATDGPNDDSEDYYFHLDDIHVKEIAPIDAAPISLDSPLESGCYGASESVMVTIGNTGTTALTSVPVTVVVTGPGATQTLTGTHTSSLAPGATASLTLQNINMTAAGTYTFTIYTGATGDGDPGNDTLRVTRTVIAPLVPSLPVVTFDGFSGGNLSTLFPGWSVGTGLTLPTGTTSSWTSNTVTGQTTAAVNLYSDFHEDWIVGPKFVNGANTHLLFKAAVTAWSPAGAASNMGFDDSVRIMISADCGASYKMFTAITRADSLTTNLRQFDIDLSVIPAGTELIVAFFATDGPGDDSEDYYFHLDDINIKEVGDDDVGVISLRSNEGCGLTSTEQICVTIQNFGALAQTNIPVSYRINSGAIMTDTIAGPLAPGDTVQHCFTATADLATPGFYTLRAFTGLTADNITSNDSTIVDIESILSPGAPTVSNVSRCGPGVVTLSATAQAGADVKWYSSQTGLVADSTGATFSPFVTANTTFYVSAASGSTETVGKPSTLGTDGTNTGGGLIFDALQPFVLQSVVVYYNGAGATLTVQLQDAGSSVLQTATFTLPNTGGNIQAVTVPLNFNVPAGTNMKLVQGTPSVSLYRDYSTGSNNFPYTSQSGNVTITDGTLAGYYYFFYSWIITSGCESPRVPVTVTVTPADAITASASQASICAGSSTNLSVSSSNTSYTYTWMGGALNGATGATQAVTPTATTTYVVMATDGNCQSFDSVTVVVAPVSVAGTADAASDTVCLGDDVNLTLTGANGDIQWQRLTGGGSWVNETGTGATAAVYNVSPTQNSSYRAVVTSGVCASATSATVDVVVSNPQITATAGDTICGPGQVTLTASGSAGAQLNWYAVATGDTALHTGGTYSPNVTATDTFYVAAVTGGGVENVGKTGMTTTGNYLDTDPGRGLLFTATKPFKLEAVHVYPTGTGTVAIRILDLSNNVLMTAPAVNVTGTGTQKVRVPVGLTVPAGSYKIGMTYTGITNMGRETSASFPYTSPSGVVTITGGVYATSPLTTYYWFYDWEISTGCESPRTAVIATVTAPPALAFTVTGNTLTRSFSTTATGVSSYSWNFGDGSAVNTTANPSHTYANAGNYTVTLTVTFANGCVATSTQQLSVIIGLKEDLAANVSLYPNPTSGKVYLELEKAEDANITVHNMQGQIVRRATTNNQTKVVLDLEGLATGSYLIKVDNGEQMFTKKILYQNIK